MCFDASLENGLQVWLLVLLFHGSNHMEGGVLEHSLSPRLAWQVGSAKLPVSVITHRRLAQDWAPSFFGSRDGRGS